MASVTVHQLLEPFVARLLQDDTTNAVVSDVIRRLRLVIEDQSRHLPSQAAFTNLLSKLTANGLDLLNYESRDNRYKMAGIAVLDCLLDVMGSDEMTERKMEIAENLKRVLESERLTIDNNMTVLRAAASAIGHFARNATTSEVEFLQTHYLQLATDLLNDVRNDTRRFAGALILTQLALNSPSIIFVKRNNKNIFGAIWEAVTDKHSIVRVAAAEALEAALQQVSQREPMSEYLKHALKRIESGFASNASEKIIGSLLVMDILTGGVVVTPAELHNIIREQGLQPHDMIWKVLQRKDNRNVEVKHKVMNLIPKLASTFSTAFGQTNQFTAPNTILRYSVRYLVGVIRAKQDRQIAYGALGRLFLAASAMRTSDQVGEIFGIISDGFTGDPFCVQALLCLGMVVSSSTVSRKFVTSEMIDSMFRGGLTSDLIETLKILIRHIPGILGHVQNQLRQMITKILNTYVVVIEDIGAGTTPMTRGTASPNNSSRYATVQRAFANGVGLGGWGSPSKASTTAAAVAAPPTAKKGWFFSHEPAPAATQPPPAPVSDVETINADALIILALETLASHEFFPKQIRDKDKDKFMIKEGANDEDQSAQLLRVLHSAVVRYLDDYNPDIRGAAAVTCLAVLDAVILAVDPSCDEFRLLFSIIDRLLLLGVGDDVVEIRQKILTTFPTSLDHALTHCTNLHCLVEGLNDESIDVRAAAMSMISRAAHYDTLHLMPVICMMLRRLLRQLQFSSDPMTRQTSVQMLQALVRGSNTLIVPYVQQVLTPLMTLLNDPSSAVVGAALSTIGELAVAAPESVRQHCDILLPRVIQTMNDHSSGVSQQEIAVVALGKLVSSLAMVTEEPYVKYPGLFEGLVRAIQNNEESSTELRLQAIRTFGLLGTVDAKVYQEYLNEIEGEYETFASPTDHIEEEAEDMSPSTVPEGERKMTKIERQYFRVVIRTLLNILREDNLSSHHQNASNIAVRIVRIVGSQAKPLISDILDGIVYRLRHTESGDNLRDHLLDHLVMLILVVGRPIRKQQSTLVTVVCEFIDAHLQPCLDIIEAMCAVFHHQDFNSVLQGVMPKLMEIIREEPIQEISIALGGGAVDGVRTSSESNVLALAINSGSYKGAVSRPSSYSYHNRNTASERFGKAILMKTLKVLQTITNMSNSLGEYRRTLLPAIVNIVDNEDINSETRQSCLCFLMYIANDPELHQFAPRIVQPILRILPSNRDPALQACALAAVSCLLCRLQTNFLPYIIPVRRKVSQITPRESGTKSSQLEEYEALVARLLKERSLPAEPVCAAEIAIRPDERIRSKLSTARIIAPDGMLHLNIQTLETAWALAGRNNASDLVEWMRRLSMELIRQAPSPIIRQCSMLAKNYKPLAEALFNISFLSVWDDLYTPDAHEVVDDIPLINSMEMSLHSPQIPSHIMTSLLNLAEFMEMQDKPLPVDVQLLAKRAANANMFAKCLRYREIEFNSPNVLPSGECIEALITVNNELGLPERAVGVLHYVTEHYSHIPIEPLWLEKLCRWEDARQSYLQQSIKWEDSYPNDIPPKHPPWMASELGKLRCLLALGELEQLEDDASKLKEHIKAADHVEEYNMWMSEVQKLGANAAWMLGKWSSLEDFLEGEIITDTHEVELNKNASFYRAILAIQKQNFAQAMSLIHETRVQLSGAISSLLSESYSRAYRAMVSMQTLAELEEVVEYKQTVAKAAVDLDSMNSAVSANDLANFTNSASMNNLLILDGSPRGTKNTGRADASAAKTALIRKWQGRLKWAPKEVDVYRQLLAVRTLVTEPTEDLDAWLDMVALCRKEGKFSLCENLLRQLGAPISPTAAGLNSMSRDSHHSLKVNHRVMFATLKFWWQSGDKQRALSELTDFLRTIEVPGIANNANAAGASALPAGVSPMPIPAGGQSSAAAGTTTTNSSALQDMRVFRVRCLLKRAEWLRELNSPLEDVLNTVMEARDLSPDHYSVWHAWAVTNYDQLKKVDTQDAPTGEDDNKPTRLFTTSSADILTPPKPVGGDHRRSYTPTDGLVSKVHSNFSRLQGGPTPARGKHSRALSSGTLTLANLLSVQQADQVTPYVVEAIKGFVHSIVLGQGQPVANILQDTLRLLTLWFSYGTKEGVYQSLTTEMDQVSPETWLSVVPQLIARMHVKAPQIAVLLRKLLMKVASTHPQALVCPISVALNTHDKQQKAVATELVNEMRKRRSQLVEEATMLSRELMRVAVTPHELWYDGLERAAQLYLDGRDIHAMVEALSELHETMSDSSANENKAQVGFTEDMSKVGHTTLRDVSFRHSYGRQLAEALDWLEMFKKSNRTTDLHQAWEIYRTVFNKVKLQLKTFKKVELHHVSPALTNASDLKLAVPGTYKPLSTVISICSFSQSIEVINSKQRPRRMAMMGSDGNTYQFLLKGHEDLRQDERVMQLFGLINVCLDNDRTTASKGLDIVRYSVLPLSNNSGVIGWVENCDTLNQLIKQYRETKDIKLGLETKLLSNKSLNYDKLPLLGKVEIFRQVLEETTGQDLAKMLWLKSKTADVWCERRASFTRSCAVMSMAGYILGLGDRHPSNLMLERVSGRVVHIDFGDCFEITKQRSKCPEIIPFRLTRMMTTAMGQSGIAGTYRVTCERVMRVMRENRDSVTAMLEAFVYDPLISWRLLTRQKETIEVPLSRAAAAGTEATDGPESPVDLLAKGMGGMGGGHVLDDEPTGGGPGPLVGGGSVGGGGALLGGDRNDDDAAERGGHTLPHGNIAASMLDAKARRGKVVQDINGPPTDADEPLQENLNARALEVITRIQAKLTGRDFSKYDDDDDLTVEQQVDRLVKEATSVENLCQLYTGWCPLW